MRYIEIAKPTTDTISTATDTSDTETLTKQPKSVRPNGVETNNPIRAIEWRSPPPGPREIVPQGRQTQTLKGSRASEHADGSRSA